MDDPFDAALQRAATEAERQDQLRDRNRATIASFLTRASDQYLKLFERASLYELWGMATYDDRGMYSRYYIDQEGRLYAATRTRIEYETTSGPVPAIFGDPAPADLSELEPNKLLELLARYILNANKPT